MEPRKKVIDAAPIAGPADGSSLVDLEDRDTLTIHKKGGARWLMASLIF